MITVNHIEGVESFDSLLNNVFLGDALDVLKRIPDNSVNLFLLDPPYNVSNLKDGSDGKNFLHVAKEKNWNRMVEEWDKIDNYLEWSRQWMRECQRCLAPNGTMYIFGTLIHNLPEIVINARELQMYIMNHIVFYKPNASPLLSGTKLKPSHEDILWMRKGMKTKYKFHYELAKQLNKEVKQDGGAKQLTDTWIINTAAAESVNYRCQKPLELIDRMILITTDPGDLVVDLFSGSGSTAKSASNLGRNFIASDLNPEAVIKTSLRLNHTPKQVKAIYKQYFGEADESI